MSTPNNRWRKLVQRLCGGIARVHGCMAGYWSAPIAIGTEFTERMEAITTLSLRGTKQSLNYA